MGDVHSSSRLQRSLPGTEMILCALWITSFCMALAQETAGLQRANVSDLPFGLQERHIVDYEPSQTDLWLLSRDDPIPVSLNRQIVSAGIVPSSQSPNGPSSSYGMRLTSREGTDTSRTLADTQQAGIEQHSQIPIYYQTVQNVGSEGRELDFNLNAPGSVLVELPVEVTEGLWARPRPQSHEQLLNTARFVNANSVNLRLDDAYPLNGQEPPLVFVQHSEPLPQLPNTELPQNAQNPPAITNYEQPYQFGSANQEPRILNPPQFHDQNVWLLREDQSSFPPADNFTTFAYHSTPEDRLPETGDVHEYGVLTSEDIELLERLGILSAVVIEPVHQFNVTTNLTARVNDQRESENEPVLIDHGGQRYLQSSGRDGVSNLRDVILIDIPHFTTPEYNTNVPENIGLRGNPNNLTLEPLRELTAEAKNGSNQIQNDTHLTDRQILEILQLLTLKAGDLTDLSSTAQGNQKPEDLSAGYPVNSTLGFNVRSSPEFTIENPSDASTTVSTTSSPASTESVDRFKTNPSAVVARIQPRLLQKLTKSDNEIIEKLLRVEPVTDIKVTDANTVDVKPKPYLFGFKQNDGNGTVQHRDEKSDALGVVKGTYGYKDPYGVYRNVSYIADRNGFHAVVRTNEPGTVSHNTADAVFMSETPPLAALVKMMAYRRIKNYLNATSTP